MNIKEAMLRSGVFRYGSSVIREGSGNCWIVLDETGRKTHEIRERELSTDLYIRDLATGATADFRLF